MSENINMPDNMFVWNSVCETDPSMTKKVTFGRNFTAIDAHSQIMKATETFGPIGKGWGFDVQLSYPPNETVCAVVTLWHGKKENSFTHVGGSDLYLRKNGEIKGPDTDAVKKATTDGVTKCLSLLGFNADVFLGKFDDNKYVQELNRKKAESANQVTDKSWPYPIKTFGKNQIPLNPNPPKDSRDPNWKGPKNKGELRKYVEEMCEIAADATHEDDILQHVRSPEFMDWARQAAHDFPQMLFCSEESECMPTYLMNRVKELRAQKESHPGLSND